MKYSLKKEENYSVSRWTGGKTKELAIFPSSSKYLDRDFIWRISSATVELDESDFSKLPDYNRVLMVLEGSAVLTYNGKRSVRLKELEQDSFDGADVTKSFGKITDFNLMVRKGCDGMLDLIYPQSEAREFTNTLETGCKYITHALYCREGYFIVNTGDAQTMVDPGQLFIMDFGSEEPAYSVMGDGVIIRAQIAHDLDVYEETASGAADGEKTVSDELREKLNTPHFEYKGGFAEDFKWAFILSNTQFRGASYIFKKLKNLWYDEELYSRINKLEKLYVTFFVFLLGLLILFSLAMKSGDFKETTLVWIFLLWFVVDCVIVSPLIYYLALPKPVQSHVRDVNKMTPEEFQMMTETKNRNERLEKLLKKYKNSGRNIGREKDIDE